MGCFRSLARGQLEGVYRFQWLFIRFVLVESAGSPADKCLNSIAFVLAGQTGHSLLITLGTAQTGGVIIGWAEVFFTRSII